LARSTYEESSIRVLKGLQPVKERPGMYTRTSDPTHIVQEAIDNAADEALGGFATRIDVTVHADHSITVEDDGRGIPVGIHPEEKVSTLEVVYTRLHAGGKFDKKDGRGAYAFSGGLHGVGVSVTNALSKRMEVEVKRDGKVHRIVFANGDVVEKLKVAGTVGPRNTGTKLRIWPEPKYFDAPDVSMPELARLLRAKAVLLPGVKVNLHVEKGKEVKTQTWEYPRGLTGYLEEISEGMEPVAPIFEGATYLGKPKDGETFAEGEGAAWAFAWYEEGRGEGESYVNLIPTAAGGTHEAGLRSGLFEAVKSFVEHHSLLPRGVRLQTEDISAKLRYVLSTRILDPQFQGQVKEKLTSRDALKLVAQIVKDPLEVWLNSHVEYGKRIAELAISQAMTRMKSAQKVEKKKGSGVAVLPGKLTDCESEDVGRRELFLVEGDSAGGSAKQARDREFQAVMPLRGKILNTWEVDPAELLASQEVHNISIALGVDPGSAKLDGLRYHKVCILADADSDGLHIATLLCALFLKHFESLVEAGHVFVAMPPLYRIDVGKEVHYALDQAERDLLMDRLETEKKNGKITVTRFKGLGEMNPSQLRETTMAPDTRRLVQLAIDEKTKGNAVDVMDMLLAKKRASDRREWLEAKGNLADV